MTSQRAKYVIHHPVQFIRRVITGFRTNQGFLLAGAIAYYTLLSIIPTIALIVALLSSFQAPDELLAVIREYLSIVTVGQSQAIVDQVQAFLLNRQLMGILGGALLIFFSSFAFISLEKAFAVIFHHRVSVGNRRFLVSAIIPYTYILLLALGLLLVSMFSDYMRSHEWTQGPVQTILVYLLSVSGEMLMFSSIYAVMPVGRLSLGQALIGGCTATLLWELVRHIMVWYFSTLSVVNLIYGTFTATIIILISLEAAAIILLLGAQVIAEYERLAVGEAPTTLR